MSNSSSLWIALGWQKLINFQIQQSYWKLIGNWVQRSWNTLGVKWGFSGLNSLKRKDFEHLLIEPITEAVMFCSKLLIRGKCFDKNDLSDIFQRHNMETLLVCDCSVCIWPAQCSRLTWCLTLWGFLHFQARMWSPWGRGKGETADFPRWGDQGLVGDLPRWAKGLWRRSGLAGGLGMISGLVGGLEGWRDHSESLVHCCGS